jgi:putative Mg2+ transporter-C (MgtC) family protein
VLIGFDRDLLNKQAGMRTLGLVGLGASAVAVTVTSDPVLSSDPDALSRVVQGVIQGVLTGVGFIGAGVVMRDTQNKEVHGLTTAASVWLTASLGIAAGLGAWRTVATATVLGIILLAVLRIVEERFGLKEAGPDDDKAPGKPASGKATAATTVPEDPAS